MCSKHCKRLHLLTKLYNIMITYFRYNVHRALQQRVGIRSNRKSRLSFVVLVNSQWLDIKSYFTLGENIILYNVHFKNIHISSIKIKSHWLSCVWCSWYPEPIHMLEKLLLIFTVISYIIFNNYMNVCENIND